MIQQLIDYNLRHGGLSVRTEVRTLLCLLTRDNRRGTEEMNNLVMTRITAAVKGHQSNPDLVSWSFLNLILLEDNVRFIKRYQICHKIMISELLYSIELEKRSNLYYILQG